MATSETDPLEDLRRMVNVANERVTALIAVLVSRGVLPPDDAAFALHSTGNDATLNQPEPEPDSGVPMGGVQ